MARSKDDARRARHVRLRKKIAGDAGRPRLLVRRTLHHIYATVVDDAKGHTLVAASTVDKSLGGPLQSNTNVDAAKAVGSGNRDESQSRRHHRRGLRSRRIQISRTRRARWPMRHEKRG